METAIDLDSCRICLTMKTPMCALFNYKVSGNYAEMLSAIANVKLSANDGLPDRICLKCSTALERAFLLKTVAERNDRKMRRLIAKSEAAKVATKKINFDTINDVKGEIKNLAIKSEPKWEFEIDLNNQSSKTVETIDGKDIVIANTVIKKIDSTADENKNRNKEESWDTTIVKTQKDDNDVEYLDDDIFQDDDDDDYVPPDEQKNKFKRPKLADIKVFKDKKTNYKKVRFIKSENIRIKSSGNPITCYPVLKNGNRGEPITLKRPKDSTHLKFDSKYVRSGPSNQIKIVKNAAKSATREKLVCPVCGILTYTLGNHLSTHQEKKKYGCTMCTRTFSQKGNLESHVKQHSGIRDHICEICGAGFYSQKSLLRHNLIHKGERPYACNLCNKRFIARCDLNRHLRIHSGYKPFKCDTCTMSFNAKHQLQNHERMHTGERPYTCQVCNVAFSYKVNLNNHVYKVHGVNLKFKSIHNVTEEVLRREMGMANETREAIAHILPELTVPAAGAHETVGMSTQTIDYNS